MKKIFYLPILILIFASCRKHPHDIAAPTTTKTAKAADTTKTAPIDAESPAGTLNMNIGTAVALMTLNQSTLNIVYNEDVVLLALTATMQQSYAVHLKEDFSASDLSDFDYYSYTREGVNAFDWVDDNLNNINKTEKDTVINNAAVTKIEVIRTFNFTHTYDSAEQAQAEYTALLTKKQMIAFSAYYAPTIPGSITIVADGTITYAVAN